jgi:hypothetical protein
MGYVLREMTEAAHSVAVRVSVLLPDNAEVWRNRVAEKYAERPCPLLWECLKDRLSVQNREAWQWIGEYLGNQPTMLIFDQWREPAGLFFENGAEIVLVLQEWLRRDFYLTNTTTSYLLCYNHHDYLIACGDAKAWLRTKIDHLSIPLNNHQP